MLAALVQWKVDWPYMQMRKMTKPQLPKLQSKTFLYGIFRSFIAIIAKSTPVHPKHKWINAREGKQ